MMTVIRSKIKVALLVFCGFANSSHAQNIEKIENAKKIEKEKEKGCEEITVGGHPYWKPYSTFNNGIYSGDSWVFADKLFKKAGIKYKKYDRKKSMAYQLLLLKKGLLDGFITYTNNDDDKSFHITTHHNSNNISLFINKRNKFPFSVIYSIQGKRGLINSNLDLGHIHETFAKYYLDIKRMSSNKQMAKDLYDGKADYAVWEENVGEELIEKLGYSNLIYKAKTPLNKQHMYVAFSKFSGCGKKLEKLNGLIEKIAVNEREDIGNEN